MLPTWFIDEQKIESSHYKQNILYLNCLDVALLELFTFHQYFYDVTVFIMLIVVYSINVYMSKHGAYKKSMYESWMQNGWKADLDFIITLKHL